jgi:predicted nicotinamide N-methyase
MTFPNPPDQPHLPQTPLEALGPIVREKVILGEREFLIDRPSDSDRLLDDPAVRAAFVADEFLPYWADLWPAARMLAKALLQETWPPGLHALEIGCGLGLPGIVALSLGMRVTFSDYDATALHFAANNARLNGFNDFECLQLDWRFPPQDRQWPILLASDLIYEMRNINPLVALIEKLLTPGGECLLTDQDRVPSHVLRDTLAGRGLPFTTRLLRAGEPGGRRSKGTLYRIRLPSA